VSELTFGMRLTYDGKSAGAGLEETRAKLDGLTNSSSKLAAQNRMLSQTYKTHSAEVQNTEAGVRKLLDRYDPLGAKLRQLQNDFKQLNSAAAGGKISGRDDARTDLVYANLQKQISLASAATNGYATASTNAARSAGQLRMANQQLPMQFQDIWVSMAAGQNPMMVLAQQGAQLSGMYGGVGKAAKAMGNYILGLINPFTVTAAAVAGSAYALYDYATSVNKARMELMQFKDDLAVMGDTAMLKRVLDLRSAVKKAEFEAVQGGFGSIGKADEAKKLNEQLVLAEAAYGKLRDAETARGDAGGIASKLALESETAKRRELEFNINLLQVYHDKQVAGSTNEIDSLSKLGELKKRLKDMDKPKSGTKDDRNQTAITGLETELFKKQMEVAGVSAAQIKVYELAKKGATDAQIESAQAAADGIIVLDAETKATQDHAKAIEETNRILANIDPLYKANAEWAKLVDLQARGLITDEQMGAAYEQAMAGMKKKTETAADGMSEVWKTYRDSTQRVLGDQMFDAMMGKFSSLEGAFKQMIFRIVANAASARLTEALFGATGQGSSSGGLIGAMMTGFGFANGGTFGAQAFANGGTFSNGLYTSPTPFKFASGGGFNLGVMGEAGPEAVMPLARDSSGKLGVRSQGGGGGGGTQIVINDHTTIHVDARSDRAQALGEISQLIDNRQAQLVDRLRREGAIA